MALTTTLRAWGYTYVGCTPTPTALWPILDLCFKMEEKIMAED